MIIHTSDGDAPKTKYLVTFKYTAKASLHLSSSHFILQGFSWYDTEEEARDFIQYGYDHDSNFKVIDLIEVHEDDFIMKEGELQ